MSWSESVSDMAYLLTCSRLSCLRFPQHLTKNYSIEERLKEEWMHVMYRPSAKKKTKMARVESWPLRKRWTLVRRFDSISQDTTTIFSGIWWAQNCNKLYYQTQLYWLKSMRQYYWVLKAIVFAATDMPFFENCRTVASYIFAWTLPAEFSFQRHF